MESKQAYAALLTLLCVSQLRGQDSPAPHTSIPEIRPISSFPVAIRTVSPTPPLMEAAGPEPTEEPTSLTSLPPNKTRSTVASALPDLTKRNSSSLENDTSSIPSHITIQPTNQTFTSATPSTTDFTDSTEGSTAVPQTSTSVTKELTTNPDIKSRSSSQLPITSMHHTSASPPNSQLLTAVQTTPAKLNLESPSELNVGDEEESQHKSGPPLDPLLAGLVSAFIITAGIVSLLLFLKYRQRNNRPEFRRLQDLPMDDMMEDTPLSMYNY